jgi:hypothetical protein
MSSLNNSADPLRDRFIEEQEYVKRYIELLQRKISLDTGELYRVINIVVEYGFADRNNLLYLGKFLMGKSYDSADVQELVSKLQRLKPDIQAALADAELKISKIERPKDLFKVDGRSLAGECIEYLVNALGREPSADEIETAREELREQLKRSEEEPVFIANDKGSIDQLVDYSVQSALYLLPAGKINKLREALYEIEDVEIAVRMSRTDTEINVLRQGFITLTTIFDATVFDLMRVALKRDFFTLIASFGKQDKVSLDKISKYSSLEEFRDEVIEEQLKSKYLREILFILQGNRVTLTDVTQGDEFIHLLEMVLRRNIHIHNRGVVDGKYLETNEHGVPRYNVYNLTAGTVAHIDSSYWERANRLSQNCITLVTKWINTLP